MEQVIEDMQCEADKAQSRRALKSKEPTPSETTEVITTPKTQVTCSTEVKMVKQAFPLSLNKPRHGKRTFTVAHAANKNEVTRETAHVRIVLLFIECLVALFMLAAANMHQHLFVHSLRWCWNPGISVQEAFNTSRDMLRQLEQSELRGRAQEIIVQAATKE